MSQHDMPVWRSRLMTADEAPVVAAWLMKLDPMMPEQLGRALPRLVQQLLNGREIKAACVEERMCPDLPWRPIAVGASAFISDDVVERLMANARPMFAMRLLEDERMEREDSGFLTGENVAKANARDGLNLLVLGWLQEAKDGSLIYDHLDPRSRALVVEGQKRLLQEHRGFKLKQIILDGFLDAREALIGTGLKIRGEFRAGDGLVSCFGAPFARDYIVSGLTREEATANMSGTPASLLFEYRPPRLGLSSSEQEVAELALDGMKNSDIADVLGATTSAIKRRWRPIFIKMQDAGIMEPDDRLEGNSEVRGREKRRIAVEYLRNHPEELRPYDDR
jgi:DNA-binding CsgD family transcriptional regulator